MKKLFEPMSPLVGWFCLMDVLSGAGLVGCWTRALHPPAWQQWGVGSVLVATALFVGSHLLLLRGRRGGVVGLIVSWLWLGLMLLPT